MEGLSKPHVDLVTAQLRPGEEIEGGVIGINGALIATNRRLGLVKASRAFGVTLRSSVIFWELADVQALTTKLGRREGTVTVQAPGHYQPGLFQPKAQADNVLVIDPHRGREVELLMELIRELQQEDAPS